MNNTNSNKMLTAVQQRKLGFLLAIKLQLVFDGAMNNPDEANVPAEKKHQESLTLQK